MTWLLISSPPPYGKYKLYHHSESTTQYMRSGGKFRLQSDYYSLGLVILEISLWQVLEDVSRKLKVNMNSSLRHALLEKRVPLLGHIKLQTPLHGVGLDASAWSRTGRLGVESGMPTAAPAPPRPVIKA